MLVYQRVPHFFWVFSGIMSGGAWWGCFFRGEHGPAWLVRSYVPLNSMFDPWLRYGGQTTMTVTLTYGKELQKNMRSSAHVVLLVYYSDFHTSVL